MKKIEVGSEFWRWNTARHRKADFKQWPIERFAIEGDEHGTLSDTRSELVKDGMLFGEIAHEELLDLQASRIPPGDTP